MQQWLIGGSSPKGGTACVCRARASNMVIATTGATQARCENVDGTVSVGMPKRVVGRGRGRERERGSGQRAENTWEGR